jgi:DHA3 family tetracycline resistance protein-like MFS transporter
MDVKVLGFVYSALSVGAVLCALILGNAKKMHKRGYIAYASWFGIGAMILLLGIQQNLWVSLAAAALLGAAATSFGLIWTSSLQEIVPTDLLGRVSSIDYLGSYTLMPIGYALAGWATDKVGAPFVFIVAGAVVCALAVLALLHPAIRKMD